MDAELLKLPRADAEGEQLDDEDEEDGAEGEGEGVWLNGRDVGEKGAGKNSGRSDHNKGECIINMVCGMKRRTYSLQPFGRQGELSSLMAGSRRWMNAVAI